MADEWKPISQAAKIDQIAKTAGVDDGPRGPIKWAYAQEKVKRGEFGVLVRIEKAGEL